MADLARAKVGLVATKNTDNLLDYLRKCQEADTAKQTAMANMVPIFGLIVHMGIEIEAAKTGDPSAAMIAATLGSLGREFGSIEVHRSLRDAFQDRSLRAVAVVDISTTRGCTNLALPDDLVFRMKVMDATLGVICQFEESVDEDSAYKASGLTILDTNNYHQRFLSGFFKVLQTRVKDRC
jgi:hypothetical protein